MDESASITIISCDTKVNGSESGLPYLKMVLPEDLTFSTHFQICLEHHQTLLTDKLYKTLEFMKWVEKEEDRINEKVKRDSLLA